MVHHIIVIKAQVQTININVSSPSPLCNVRVLSSRVSCNRKIIFCLNVFFTSDGVFKPIHSHNKVVTKRVSWLSNHNIGRLLFDGTGGELHQRIDEAQA